MVTFLKKVQARRVPEGLYDFLPLQACLVYNIKESTEGFEMQAELERKKMEMLGTAGHSEGDRK